ncbi:unnamed protein product [Lymnaea stagnalis]|uniref:Uncharacterized protein n=1 Tax=Lymnaea stagnalis TaxID=6523 RepID=A0AAV2HL53_LYMST
MFCTLCSNFILFSYINCFFNGSNAQKLLAERILVLTLIALLNIPNQYVEAKFEVYIRKCLLKLDYKAVPKRLKTLVDEVKKGKKYPDIARSGAQYFSIQNHNELMFCKWQSHSNYLLVYTELNISNFPNILFYDTDRPDVMDVKVRQKMK